MVFKHSEVHTLLNAARAPQLLKGGTLNPGVVRGNTGYTPV
jgi:hypothetical protein